jgi:serine O-acetyltransferase
MTDGRWPKGARRFVIRHASFVIPEAKPPETQDEPQGTSHPMGNHEISATVPDWSRERSLRWWDPGRRLLQAIRGYQRWRDRGGAWRRLRGFWVLRYRFWSVVAGAEIPLETPIGGGLLLPHPNGIVIHPGVVIGPNCMIFQQVTVGFGESNPGVPVLGGHVDVGAGAKVLGGVRIGDHARIGPNAVVLHDVPAGATVVGIPAKLL